MRCATRQLAMLGGRGSRSLYKNLSKERKLMMVCTSNVYPNCGVDTPAGFYSLSFAPSANFSGQWTPQDQILGYIRGVKTQYQLKNITFQTDVLSASWLATETVWKVQIKNNLTGEEDTKTCNVLASAVGLLQHPLYPELVDKSAFQGPIFHTARYDHTIDLTAKAVVVIGNGCSAVQLIPGIMPKVKSLAQLLLFQRFLIFCITESFFPISDIKKGAGIRKQHLKTLINYTAPKKYWDALLPDFDVSQKRRIFDGLNQSYLAAMHYQNFELVQDEGITCQKAHSVVTTSGREIKADVIILATGFAVHDYTYPLQIYGAEGESLVERFKSTKSPAKAYIGTFVSGFPNFAMIAGPNLASGHSSAIMPAECQIMMILKVMQPVLSRLQSLGQNCLSSRGSEIGGRGRLLSASEGDDEGESVGERWEIIVVCGEKEWPLYNPLAMVPKPSDTASSDTKSHYNVIIIGSGVSGLAMNIQLKRKLGIVDVICYEGDDDVGGTWYANTYPGASVDIPAGFYSFSFAPSSNFSGQWIRQPETLKYIRSVQEQFQVDNIVFRTQVLSGRWSNVTGLWTVKIKNKVTGEEATKTCNVLISAVGGLREPNIPEFAKNSPFEGEIFHSARWNHSVELAGKKVLLVGNGCSAAQIVPEIIPKVQSLVQVARSRQTIMPRPPIPDGRFWWFLCRWIPGFLKFQRAFIFLANELVFKISHIKKGVKIRRSHLKTVMAYMHAVAPKKYWSALTPDFDVAAKRRIFEDPQRGYFKAINSPNFDLIQDDSVTALTAHSALTANGRNIEADVIVLSTGFAVHDYTYPLQIYNGEGESLLDRFRATNVRSFRGTFVAGFPNFGLLMGPNVTTGHSSVIFTSECQVTMILKVLGPVLQTLPKISPSTRAAPSVEVTLEAEKAHYKKLRAAMKERVWENNGGVSWYVDKTTGMCTTLNPWSQINFWWHATYPNQSDFQRKGF